jgi:phenylacetate-CoA ligase
MNIDSKALRFFLFKFGLLERSMQKTRALLEVAERMNSEELRQLNWERRIQLVRHCAENVPYYKRLFSDIDFAPEDLKSEEDFQRLPILEKSDLRDFCDDFITLTRSKENLNTATTGGTTGQPLKIYRDPGVHLSSMSWRMLKWWGMSPSDNSAYLYRKIPTGLRKLLMDIALFPTKRRYIAAADMTEENLGEFLQDIVATRPKYLVGYVGAIEEFARYLENEGKTLNGLGGVWSTSAPMTEAMRRRYESAFQCPVYTQYGSCEFYWIAAECKQKSGMHIGSDIRHVEIVEGDRCVPIEEFGDVVVTDLIDYAFPLLRYRIGDRGRLLSKQCSCGRPFPLMDYVRGRVSDAIKMPDGTTIPGEYWTTIFDDFSNEIKAFQVWQHKNYELEIRYEPHSVDGSDCALKIVEQRLKQKLRGRIALRFSESSLVVNKSGKIKFVHSELA